MRRGRHLRVPCPAPGHVDTHPSCDVDLDRGWTCRACHAGGGLHALAGLLGLTAPERGGRRGPVTRPRVPAPPPGIAWTDWTPAWLGIVQAARRQADRLAPYRDLYWVSDWLRARYQLVADARYVVSALGPDDPAAWRLARLAARVRRGREVAPRWMESVVSRDARRDAIIERYRAVAPSTDAGPWPTLDAVHALFRMHYGARYDTGALDAVIAAAATTFLTGDPVWLLVIGGSGGLKTETVTAARLMPGATKTSTITSVGALLSGTAQQQRAKDATGGLLRRIGNPGLLLIKDVSSILSMNRDARALVLSALREVYDGSWVREVGTDGGRTISWAGRIVVIGAVTTAWDHHASVIAAMGDRFVLVRLDTNDPDTRDEAGDCSMANVGREGEIQQAVAEAVAGLLARPPAEPPALTPEEKRRLRDMANFVTRARTAVETDYHGDVIAAHALEMPTRFLKQLVQLVRGALGVGMARERALALALRCAIDSIPPMRLAVCLDLLDGGRSKAGEVAGRLVEDTRTVARVLSGLASLRVVHRELVPEPGFRGQAVDVSYYSLLPAHVPIITQIAAFSRGGKVEEGREGEKKQCRRARA